MLSVFGVESVVGSSDAQAVPSDMGEEDSEATDSQGSASDDDYSDDSQTVAPYDPVESARLIASENRLLQRLLPRRNLFAYSDSKEPTRTLLEDEIGPLGVLNDDAAVVLTTQTAVVQLRRSLPSYPSFVSPSVLSSRF